MELEKYETGQQILRNHRRILANGTYSDVTAEERERGIQEEQARLKRPIEQVNSMIFVRVSSETDIDARSDGDFVDISELFPMKSVYTADGLIELELLIKGHQPKDEMLKGNITNGWELIVQVSSQGGTSEKALGFIEWPTVESDGLVHNHGIINNMLAIDKPLFIIEAIDEAFQLHANVDNQVSV